MRELETERLRLRALRPDDVQAIFDGWASDPEVTRYLTWNPHKSPDQTRTIMDFWLGEYEKADCFRYGIERKADKTLMGMLDVVGFRDGTPVIGYCSGRQYWNQGYMTEAFQAVIRELFACGYSAIIVEAVRENTGSNRVIEKCGFRFTGSSERPLSRLKPDIVTINAYRLDKSDV